VYPDTILQNNKKNKKIKLKVKIIKLTTIIIKNKNKK
jgi:hypothetical protein